MDRNNRDWVERAIRIATAAACIVTELAKAIGELTKIHW